MNSITYKNQQPVKVIFWNDEIKDFIKSSQNKSNMYKLPQKK